MKKSGSPAHGLRTRAEERLRESRKLGTPAGAGAGEETYPERLIGELQIHQVELEMYRLAPRALEARLAREAVLSRDHTREELRERRAALWCKGEGERPSCQLSPRNPEQGGSGEVRLPDQALPVEGEVADRGEIVEVEVVLEKGCRLVPGLRQLLVLQLQLYLVNLQLVDQPLRVLLLGRARARACARGRPPLPGLPEPRFRTRSESCLLYTSPSPRD